MPDGLSVVIGADADPLIKELQRAQREFQKWGNDFTHSLDGIRGVAESLGTLFGVAIGGGMALMLKNTLDATEALESHARALGLDVEKYQALQFAATRAGVEQESFNTGLNFLSKTVGEASVGIQGASDKFTRWGISIKDAHGNVLPLNDVLSQIANRMTTLGSAAQQSALMTELMGRAAVNLKGLFLDGAEGLAAMEQKARDAGAVMDASLVQKGAEADRELKSLGMVINTELKTALINVLGDMNNFHGIAGFMIADLKGLNEFIDMLFNNVNHQGLSTLTNELTLAQHTLQRLQEDQKSWFGTFLSGGVDSVATGIEHQQKRIAEIRAAIAELNKPAATAPAQSGSGTFTPIDMAAVAQIKQGEQALADYIEKLRDLHNFNSLSAEDQAIQKSLSEAESIARRNNISLTQEQIDTIRQLSAANYEQALAVQRWKQVTEEMARTFTSSFTRMLEGTNKFGDGLKSLALDFVHLAEKMLIMKPLEDSFQSFLGGGSGGGGGGGLGGLGGLIGGLFGGSEGARPSADFVGPMAESSSLFSFLGFADGGRPTPGVPALVGENGPELWVPDQAGTVIPHGGQMSGGSTFYIDARGVDGAQVARLEGMVRSLGGQLMQWAGPGVTEARVKDARTRGKILT